MDTSDDLSIWMLKSAHLGSNNNLQIVQTRSRVDWYTLISSWVVKYEILGLKERRRKEEWKDRDLRKRSRALLISPSP